MNYNFYLIDENFVNRLSEKIRDEFKDKIYNMYFNSLSKNSKKLSIDNFFKNTRRVKVKFVQTYCAYCKASYTMIHITDINDLNTLKYCMNCGENSIFLRFSTGIKKIRNMITLSSSMLQSNKKNIINDLNQQILVLIASTLEIYLRDYYITFLNMTLIKPDSSQIERFKKDCKNDFINIDKTIDRFKKELNINLKSLINVDTYNSLKELSLYRNVIVHNNGICDKKFLNYNIGRYTEHDLIKVSIKALNKYRSAISKVVHAIQPLYETIHINECISQIKYNTLRDTK